MILAADVGFASQLLLRRTAVGKGKRVGAASEVTAEN